MTEKERLLQLIVDKLIALYTAIANGVMKLTGDQSADGVKTFNDGIKTDTISEKTSTAGVTADGVLLKDGNAVAGATNLHTWAGDITTGIQRVSNGVFNLNSAGTSMAKVTANGFQLLQRVILGGTPQTLTGAGAISLDTFVTLLVTTGANAITLAAGSEGQIKLIVLKTNGGDGTLTPSTLIGGTTVVFNDANDLWLTVYTDGNWRTLVNSGCTIA